MSIPTPTPTVGRIVYFQMPQPWHKRTEPPVLRPAVIIAVHDENTVDLSVFGKYIDGHKLAHEDTLRVRRSSEGLVKTWDWMPYQKGGGENSKAAEAARQAADIQALQERISELEIMKVANQIGWLMNRVKTLEARLAATAAPGKVDWQDPENVLGVAATAPVAPAAAQPQITVQPDVLENVPANEFNMLPPKAPAVDPAPTPVPPETFNGVLAGGVSEDPDAPPPEEDDLPTPEQANEALAVVEETQRLVAAEEAKRNALD